MGTASRQFKMRAVVRSAVRSLIAIVLIAIVLIAIVLIAALVLAYPIRRVADASRRNFNSCVASRVSDAQGTQTPAERYAQLGECAAST